MAGRPAGRPHVQLAEPFGDEFQRTAFQIELLQGGLVGGRPEDLLADGNHAGAGPPAVARQMRAAEFGDHRGAVRIGEAAIGEPVVGDGDVDLAQMLAPARAAGKQRRAGADHHRRPNRLAVALTCRHDRAAVDRRVDGALQEQVEGDAGALLDPGIEVGQFGGVGGVEDEAGP
ncbi:hypothetical protein [Jiella pelagia]|uniref:Uncharacterized protein n=1 Tax=Jiella pelagia TaxID=2986949 RepID=A0ABY7BTH3_9HYPH|nr:hypothetical protein [Jiella pelagia]WAP66952.1 hypothetical protein OH818_14950 [Jiella pelagia]